MPWYLQPPDTVELLMFDGVCNLCNGLSTSSLTDSRRVKFQAQQKHMELERVGAPTGTRLVLIKAELLRVLRLGADGLAVEGASAAASCRGRARSSSLRVGTVFGKSDECRAPSGDFAARFIDFWRSWTPIPSLAAAVRRDDLESCSISQRA